MKDNELDKKEHVKRLKSLSTSFAEQASKNIQSKKSVDLMIERFEKDLALECFILSKENDGYVFLIDGSASMGSQLFGLRASPLNMALADLEVSLGAYPKVNANVLKALWGNQRGITILEKGCFFSEGLNSGSNLSTAIGDLSYIASKTKILKTKQHFIIVSDGDVHDFDKSYAAAHELLKNNKHVTLYFKILSQDENSKSIYLKDGSNVEKLAKRLVLDFPKSVKLSVINIRRNLPSENIFSDMVKKYFQPKSKTHKTKTKTKPQK